MTGLAVMKLPVNKLSITQLSVRKFPVILALFIGLAIAVGAQDDPMAPGEASINAMSTSDAPAEFNADSFFGSSDGGASVSSKPCLEAGLDPASATAAGFAGNSGSVFTPSSRQVSGLVFTGEATADLMYSITEPFDSSTRSGTYNGLSSLRLDAMGGNRNEAKIEASVIVNMAYGDRVEEMRAGLIDTLQGDFPDTATILVAQFLGTSGPLMTVDLKKLYLSVYMPRVDVSIGRMMVNYGRGTVFSPVDLFSGVDTGDISLGRTGNDALRVLFPFGNFSGLDLVSTIAGRLEQSIAGGRFFGQALDWDFGLSAFRDGRSSAGGDADLVIGLDFKGDLELGVSAEALARLPFETGSPDPSEAVYSLMAGLDYSIKGQWFFDLEYLWNIRAGHACPVGGFRHQHNLFASLSWKPDELTALDVRTIIVPAETLGQLSIGVSRSIARGASLLGFVVFRNGNVENIVVPPTPGYDPDATVLSFGGRLSVAY